MSKEKDEKKIEKEQNKLSYERQRARIYANYIILAGVAIIAIYFAFLRYEGLLKTFSVLMGALTPVIAGIIMAYLMNPMMVFLEKELFVLFSKFNKNEKKALKTARNISSIISILVLLGILALFFSTIIPEVINTVDYLSANIGKNIDHAIVWLDRVTKGRFEVELVDIRNGQFANNVTEAAAWVRETFDFDEKKLVSQVAASAYSVVKFLMNILIGFFVAVYALMSKELFRGQFKKLMYGFFKPHTANVILEVARKSNEIFYGFISGKILDSFIIGIICYVVMEILNLPYTVLISIIVGVTNIVPVFGPYIGAVPSFIIIFLTEPIQGFTFLIMVLVLQQIDGNVIGPKILGDSTGLSSFWVVFAIVVGGSLFGFTGMLLGVPTVGVIYYLMGRFSKWMLRRKGLEEDTLKYINLDAIDAKTLEMIERTQEQIDEQKNKSVIHTIKKKVVNTCKSVKGKVDDYRNN